MGRRLEYEVKTSVRLNMSNPQHGYFLPFLRIQKEGGNIEDKKSG